MSGNSERPKKSLEFEEFMLFLGHLHRLIDWDWFNSLKRPVEINLMPPRATGRRWVWRVMREWERQAAENNRDE